MTKLLIGPYETGLQKNLEPWLLPNDAFTEIEDAYVWRGRIKRKNGYRMLQRLHLTPILPEAKVAVVAGSITYTATLTNPFASPGTIIINIAYGGGFIFTDNGNGTLTATTLPAGINYGWGTINYLTGVFVLNWDTALAAGGPYAVNVTQYRYWPMIANERLPCMGLFQYERPAINREDLIAFDTTYSYLYNSGLGLFDVQTDAALNRALWTSTNSDFFWCTNYYFDTAGNYLFWATNGLASINTAGWIQNGIFLYDGIFWYAQNPMLIDNPAPTPDVHLRGCLLLIPYRNRLVALNTLEGPNVGLGGALPYVNRARWCQNGVPYVSGLAGSDANSWRTDINGRGGYIDAPTTEAIISARFFKDTLIVFFEKSTWELRYTGNELLPFLWYKVNADYGCESTFSTVQFDDGVYAIGDKRIVIANSVQVQPIDTKIPDAVFEIENENSGVARVHGIRDYYKKFVYWTFPTALRDQVFPDKVLALNYEEGSFSFFNDTFTCFGYYQANVDYTWATIPWIWSEWNLPWGTAQMQAWFPDVVAGNQDGNVLVLDKQSNNAPAIDLWNTAAIPTITAAAPAVFYSPNHNLYGDFDALTNYYDGNYVKVYYVNGFSTPVVGETVGTALAGSVQFTGDFGIANAIVPWYGYIILTAVINVGALTYIDLGDGTLIETTGTLSTGTINYESKTIKINFAALGADTPVTINYLYNPLNYRTFTVNELSPQTFTLSFINDNGTITPLNLNGFAPYNDWAVVQMVNNYYVRSKGLTPFVQQDEGIRLNFLDIYTTVATGQMTFNFFIGDSDSQTIESFIYELYKVLPGNSISSDKIWKRGFPNIVSDIIQFEILMSPVQMRDSVNYNSAFELHALILDVVSSGRLIGYS